MILLVEWSGGATGLDQWLPVLRPACWLERLARPRRWLAPPTGPPVYGRACPSRGLPQPKSAITARPKSVERIALDVEVREFRRNRVLRLYFELECHNSRRLHFYTLFCGISAHRNGTALFSLRHAAARRTTLRHAEQYFFRKCLTGVWHSASPLCIGATRQIHGPTLKPVRFPGLASSSKDTQSELPISLIKYIVRPHL